MSGKRFWILWWSKLHISRGLNNSTLWYWLAYSTICMYCSFRLLKVKHRFWMEPISLNWSYIFSIDLHGISSAVAVSTPSGTIQDAVFRTLHTCWSRISLLVAVSSNAASSLLLSNVRLPYLLSKQLQIDCRIFGALWTSFVLAWAKYDRTMSWYLWVVAVFEFGLKSQSF